MTTVAGDLTAALAGIRERGYRNGATGAECARLSDAAAVDIPRLLAAVEAALKLAGDWDAEARGIFLEAARTADAGEVGAASALQSSAADLREVISREITGKGESDSG